tara:strand:- start:9043 stop:9189 length:147 start_codon:yes stop_codon:yes gene_type:complete
MTKKIAYIVFYGWLGSPFLVFGFLFGVALNGIKTGMLWADKLLEDSLQ